MSSDDDEKDMFRVTLRDETVEKLFEAFPHATNRQEAIRMAIDTALWERGDRVGGGESREAPRADQ